MNTRRHFLKVLGASASFVVACGDNGGQSEASGTFAAGNVSALSVGTIKAIDGQPLVIARDAGGIYAMSTICTHEQCDMNGGDGHISNTELVCTCHSSHFDANGNRTAGPASGQLKHYKVTMDASGELTITASPDSVVSGDTRLTVSPS